MFSLKNIQLDFQQELVFAQADSAKSRTLKGSGKWGLNAVAKSAARRVGHGREMDRKGGLRAEARRVSAGRGVGAEMPTKENLAQKCFFFIWASSRQLTIWKFVQTFSLLRKDAWDLLCFQHLQSFMCSPVRSMKTLQLLRQEENDCLVSLGQNHYLPKSKSELCMFRKENRTSMKMSFSRNSESLKPIQKCNSYSQGVIFVIVYTCEGVLLPSQWFVHSGFLSNG